MGLAEEVQELVRRAVQGQRVLEIHLPQVQHKEIMVELVLLQGLIMALVEVVVLEQLVKVAHPPKVATAVLVLPLVFLAHP